LGDLPDIDFWEVLIDYCRTERYNGEVSVLTERAGFIMTGGNVEPSCAEGEVYE
jgi:hypothetical protein